MNPLAGRLAAAGLSTVASGGRILVSPYGGRVLGLFPDGETNLLWVNPKTLQPERLADWRAHRAWSNLGGDRVWISPEIDTNVPDPRRFGESYTVPPALDPGDYALSEDAGALVLAQNFTLLWLRTGQMVTLALRRVIRPLEAPSFAVPTGLAAAGYAADTRLTALTPLGKARPAVWNLLQVPGGGEVIARVRPGAQPISFINTARWTANGGTIRTFAQTNASFKWSLRAEQCTGRLMYFLSLEDGRAGLVVRDFPVAGDDAYADCPCHTPAQTGHMCQVYVDDGQLGGFAELESHAPSLGTNSGSSDEAQVTTWGFVGPPGDIHALQDALSINPLSS